MYVHVVRIALLYLNILIKKRVVVIFLKKTILIELTKKHIINKKGQFDYLSLIIIKLFYLNFLSTAVFPKQAQF